jgi:uncharacterized protein YaiL (DUF2058 family)
MGNSLRDQLMGLGYAPAPKPEPSAERKPSRPGERPGQGRPTGARERPGQGKPAGARDRSAHGKPTGARDRPGPGKSARSREEIDLGKAYALRAQKEKDDRIEAERIKQEEAKLRREAKARVSELIKDKALNDPAAEIARHFPYGGKIKRIHVNPDQLKALNAGELGVAQMDGRYLLLPMALLLEAEAIFPAAVALKVDPDAAPGDDPYSDPAYQVPDDLIW